MKNNKKKWLLPLLFVAAIVVVLILVVYVKKGSRAVSVVPVSSIEEPYYEYDSENYGSVSEGKIQEVKLKDALVEEVRVSEGQEVKAGDVLLVYDVGSYQLTLKADEAKIASLENGLKQAKEKLSQYQTLIPSEYAKEATTTVIHHKAPEVATLAAIHADTAPSGTEGGIVYYNCSEETVVDGACLANIYASGTSVECRIYRNNVIIGSWVIGGNAPKPTVTPEPTDTPEPTEEPEPTAEPEGISTQAEVCYEDWRLGDGVTFNGDGTVEIDFSVKHYGTFSSLVPEESEWDEYIIDDPTAPDEKGNYMYSKAELAAMCKEQEKQIKSTEIEIKSAKLKLQKDQLVSDTGEVKATINGVVTKLKPVSQVATDGVLMEIQNKGETLVVAYVNELDLPNYGIGGTASVTGLETGASGIGTITEIGTEPQTEGYGSGNPNSSSYPVTLSIKDSDAEFRTEETCSVVFDLQKEVSNSTIYIPKKYVRSDDAGSYVYIADENNKLCKQYVLTGQLLWGYLIEVRGGITGEDRIAFPYGKAVKEGAPVTGLEE